MNTAASVLLFRILHIVILFSFGLILLCEYLNILACEPLFPGGYLLLYTVLCLRGRTEGHSVSASLLTSRGGLRGLQISTGVPQASHNLGHHSFLFAFGPKTPWVLQFHFLPCAERAPLLIWGGASLGIWRAKDGVRIAQKQLFPKVIQLLTLAGLYAA